MRKRVFAGILAVIVITVLLAACSLDGSLDELKKEAKNKTSDIWSTVTSLDQLQGTWTGTYSVGTTMKQLFEFLGESWDYGLEQIFQGMKVFISCEQTVYIDLLGNVSGISVITIRFQGGSISYLWPDLKEGFEEDGFICDDSNYSATTTENFTDFISPSEMALYEINQYGNKMRGPVDTEGWPGAPSYMIMKKIN